MPNVLRWGRSAYETDADLARERAGIEALGLGWSSVHTTSPPSMLAETDALVVTSGVRVDDAVVQALRGRFVLTTTSGYDHVDLDACRATGVTVARCAEARRDAVVEWSIASAIALLRRQPALGAHAVRGSWARGELPALTPLGGSGARVCIVGLGVIGSRVAEVARVLGADVIGVDPAGVPPTVRPLPLDDALPIADVVTLHCSLSDTSRGLLGAERLARLRPSAVLVNTARGDVLDFDAAVEAVRGGRLRGLACDVFPEEPLASDRLAAAAGVPGVWLTPHAAGYTADLGVRVAHEVVAAITAWSQGGPAAHRVV